ncbi:MAG: glycosyltransferase family 2 protein [Leptolyngbyaceae cyanobacterium SM1_3_5]|nr:glycosyltransferase family 2 protein [Leptolyngbyaceae cyanobacterium SM1_3_5]
MVQEARPGGSYGRNAAIAATTSEIIVTIDDDITVPPDWLEKLIAPMGRAEVRSRLETCCRTNSKRPLKFWLNNCGTASVKGSFHLRPMAAGLPPMVIQLRPLGSLAFLRTLPFAPAFSLIPRLA